MHDDELDPELAALYAKERAMPLPDGATTRVLAAVIGVTAGTAASTASAATTATTGISAGKVVAIAVASAIGGGTIAVVGYRELASPPAIEERAPVREPELRPDAPIGVDAGVDAYVIDAPALSATPRPPGRPIDVDADVPEDTREPLLIDRARAALQRGMVDEALATLMRHERVHPAGALAEERDVLIIEAYAAQNNTALAKRRIERYRREHPAGFLRARVDRVEAALPP